MEEAVRHRPVPRDALPELETARFIRTRRPGALPRLQFARHAPSRRQHECRPGDGYPSPHPGLPRGAEGVLPRARPGRILCVEGTTSRGIPDAPVSLPRALVV